MGGGAHSTVRCLCDPGWGDTSCQHPLPGHPRDRWFPFGASNSQQARGGDSSSSRVLVYEDPWVLPADATGGGRNQTRSAGGSSYEIWIAGIQ